MGGARSKELDLVKLETHTGLCCPVWYSNTITYSINLCSVKIVGKREIVYVLGDIIDPRSDKLIDRRINLT